ncbi:MAG: polysaccharide lyase family protein [Pyrinomonadaceae bacterium MAG19_C2-C3]|nr:polysaccharide lyase family protein [Pyrinomonadaceae bacterium MAG19_C2-C3]
MTRPSLQAFLLSLIMFAGASAQERVVWQIGDFNNTSFEFSSDPVPTGRVYVVPQSQPKEWAGSQSAVLPDKAGEAMPGRIRFELPNVPRGMFTLKLGLIVKTARVPLVLVDVNTHRGLFHQRIATNYKEGNHEGAVLPQYSIGTLSVEIPADFLRQGSNELALTAVADHLSTALPGGEVIDNATLIYDALALGNNPDAAIGTGILSAEATPTVFYQRRESGKLTETVSVLVRWNKVAPRGMVTLSLPGWTRAQPLTSDNEFGEQRFEFSVPEFAAGTRATINVTANNQSKAFTESLNPGRKWTLYMVAHEHLDIGYSDFQTKLMELHSRIIDEAMEMNGEHPEFHFSLDGYWQARQFLEGRSEAEKQKFFNLVRDRKIHVPAQHSVILTGFPTAEALLRSFYGSHQLNRAYGGAWDYANATDVPSYSWSYASILAASGLKYFAAAANADRGPTLMLGDLHRRSPFWWEGPDGSRVLMWYARHYHQVGSEFGLPTRIANGYEGLANFLRVYERPDYKSNSVLLHGSQWENTSLYPQQAGLAQEWNKLFAYPELRFSGFAEAMEKIAGDDKDRLPVVRGDGGPYWEDGIASDALYAAMERETERRAVTAEKLATVASLVDSRSRPSRESLNCMWENIALMNEHTWGWGRSVTEPHSEDSVKELEYKRASGTTARGCMEAVLDRAMTAIAGRIGTPTRALVVFNALNWSRDGWVEFDLQKTREIVDIEAGWAIGFEVLQDEPAYQRIRFLARDVPAMGYRTYEVRDKTVSAIARQPANQADKTDASETANQIKKSSRIKETTRTDSDAAADTATNTANAAQADSSPVTDGNSAPTQSPSGTIENRFYRVVLDPASGAVRSVYDKQLKRELVDASSPYRLNQYVYVTGGDSAPNQLLNYVKWAPFAQLETHASIDGKLISVSKTASGTIARLESRSRNTPRISTEIILFDDEKKIEFINRVVKDKVYKKEAAYFAFPLAVREPQFRYEVQNGVVNPATDMIPGAGLEWFSSQNWMAVSEPGVSVAVINKDSFLWSFGDIVRGTYPTKFEARRGTAFSYVINNYWNTNYVAAQGGEFTFRYVLTSSQNLDPARLSQMGWEETTPLERTLVKSQDRAAPAKNPLATKLSFLQISNPSIVLSAWKLSEDGEGSVMRFIELGGKPDKVSVMSSLLNSTSAQTCNAMEECGESLPSLANGYSFNIGARQIFTTKIIPARKQN